MDIQEEIKGIKRTLFGDDGLGGLTKKMTTKASWMFFWIAFCATFGFFMGGFAYLGLEMTNKASASDTQELRDITTELTVEMRNLIKTLKNSDMRNDEDHIEMKGDIKDIKDIIRGPDKKVDKINSNKNKIKY